MVIPPIRKLPHGSPPIRFTRLVPPVIKPKWYKRLYRYVVGLFKPKPLSLREVLMMNSVKEER